MPINRRSRASGKEVKDVMFDLPVSTATRYIKCDEHPDLCKNCSTTGRTCDGYDLHRVHVNIISRLTDLGTRPNWVMTVEEQRAVYHAVIALSAIQQDSRRAKQHARLQYALEQSTRSFALLSKRHTSQDPELHQVIVLCCLLFVIADMLCGRRDTAFMHLQSGLRILKELEIQRRLEELMEESLVTAFVHLDIQLSNFRSDQPGLCSINRPEDEVFKINSVRVIQILEQTLSHLDNLMRFSSPLRAKYWAIAKSGPSGDEHYPCLLKQRMLLSHFRHFAELCAAELVRLQYLDQLLAQKTCPFDVLEPKNSTSDYLVLLEATEAFDQISRAVLHHPGLWDHTRPLCGVV
ncbi:uncharacterized protein BDW43DRAFT_309696 [Aspergillus alliaceus]|uniref:uncharacterized protein n=1 Tax=Petromyces alliaceus TaxID=209559 RepID=UPI0012A5EC26|nr:uncharacterized protein BDW43DRAFT_309696 [Aspergillus alliaceus]KAB8234858.1 hypothetical protein BDW43DRAFT_309696 [Aspergillus alliaceus]